MTPEVTNPIPLLLLYAIFMFLLMAWLSHRASVRRKRAAIKKADTEKNRLERLVKK
jgi:hypothetical protein